MILLLVVNDSALVFDLHSVRELRELGIVGVLVGTLPRAPQQNVFLGLPLRLSVYETCWLVCNGHAKLVDGAIYNATVASTLTAGEVKNRCRLPLDGARLYAVTPDVYQALAGNCAADTDGSAVAGSGRDLGPDRGDSRSDGSPDDGECGNGGESDGSEEGSCESSADASEQARSENADIGGLGVNGLPEAEMDPVIAASSLSLHEFLARQNLPVDFHEKYAAFAHLRNKDYFMMPGLRFGGVFVAYPGDPLQYHSHLIVKVVAQDKTFNLIDMVTSGRLATAVKKAWVVIGEDTRPLEDKPTLTEPKQTDQTITPAPMRAFSIEWAGFG